jgi:catechol 2,3-dioxygenase-like lactoylglutathione lyase family enzyme
MEQPQDQINERLVDRVDQIGFVVRDVDEFVKSYEKILGEGAFVVAEGEAPATLADGREVMVHGRLAWAQLGSVQLEVIQIIQGPSVHLDFLEEHGEGMHHLGIYVADFDETLKKCRERGIDVLQHGQSLRRYAYLDTKPVILELIENV